MRFGKEGVKSDKKNVKKWKWMDRKHKVKLFDWDKKKGKKDKK